MATTAVILPESTDIVTETVAESIVEQIAEDVSEEIEDELEWLKSSLRELAAVTQELNQKVESLTTLVYPLTEHNRSLMEMVTRLVETTTLANSLTPPEPLVETVPEPIVEMVPVESAVVPEAVVTEVPQANVRKRRAI